MLTFLLFVQLSAAPLTPPQKPIEFPKKQPAMFARETEITQEVRRREKGKVLTFTLLPHSAVVTLAHECLIESPASVGSVASVQTASFGFSALSFRRLPKNGKGNTGQAKYNRRCNRNW
jgi:hypothetical protein